MFYRASLDFAAKLIFNQSDASIADVMIPQRRFKMAALVVVSRTFAKE